MLDILEVINNSETLYKKLVEDIRNRYQLTQTEFDVLMFLFNNPECDKACDIVNKRHISKSHVSSSLKSLEKREYIQVKFEGDNKKNKHLVLCEKSKEITNAGKEIQNQLFNILMNGFSKEEIITYNNNLKRINQNVKEALR